MKFVKMQGAGNDYIYFDCIDSPFPTDPAKASPTLSDRHFGIGGDGIVLILPSSVADFRMRIFNADGSEGKMCGNATRCVGKYLFENQYTDKKEITLETASGIKRLFINETGAGRISVSTDMGRVSFNPEDVPAVLPCDAESFTVRGFSAVCVSVGNPHCVVFCDDIRDFPLAETAAELTSSGIFPEGVNLEIAKVCEDGIDVRVFERGSGETLACGTGACAVAAAAIKKAYFPSSGPVAIRMTGGLLHVSFPQSGNAWLEGPAQTVFTGEIAP